MRKHLFSILLASLLSPGLALGQDEPDAADLPAVWGLVRPKLLGSSVDGSSARAGLYVRPWSGPALDILGFDLRGDDGFDAVDLYGTDLFRHRFDLTGSVWTRGIPAMLRLTWDEADFYDEPFNPREAGRRNLRFEARVHPGSDVLVRGDWWQQRVDLPGNLRVGPIRYDSDEVRARVDVPLGPGVFSFGLGNLTYRDRLGSLPSTNSHHYDLLYSALLNQEWSLSGAAQWASIGTGGRPGNDLFSLGLRASYQPSAKFRATGRLHHRDLNYGVTANSYVSEQTGGGLDFSYRPSRSVRLQAGFDHSEMDRFNAIQSAVEHPAETRVFASANYRGWRQLRASLKYQYRTLDNLSASAVPRIFSPLPLFFDAEHRLDLRASLPLKQVGLGYGFWRFRQRSMSARNFEETSHSAGLGISWPLRRDLTVTGDLYWRLVDTNWPVLAGLDADTMVAHLGLGYQPSEAWSLWADYRRAEGYYGENADQNFFSAGVSADLGDGRALTLGYNREGYDNGLFGALDYDLDVVSVSYATPF